MKPSKTAPLLPVMHYRETIGHARTMKGAERLIRLTVSAHSTGTLEVWQRPEHIAEILGLPVAWVWGISWGAK